MAPAVGYVRDHQSQVLAYFDALQLVGRDLWSPTTNSLERHNSDIQAIWRSGKSYARDFETFQLRVLYNRYRFGLDLKECSRCGRFDGPFEPNTVLERSMMTQIEADAELCDGCTG